MLRLIGESDSVIEAALSKALSSIVLEAHETTTLLRDAKQVICVTDFSTSDIKGGQNYKTAAVLIMPVSELAHWSSLRKGFRDGDRFGLQSVSYKSTRNRNDHMRRLLAFLFAASQINGMLVTVSVPSSEKHLFTRKGDCHSHPNLAEFKHWDESVFEDLVRIASVLAVCLRTFLQEGQFVGWLCDQDAIAENDSREALAGAFVKYWIGSHLGASFDLDIILPNSPRLLDRSSAEDLLSIPDMAAGGIGDTLANFATQFGPDRLDEWIPSPEGQKSKAASIASWFAATGIPLTRAALSVESVTGKAVAHFFDEARYFSNA